MSKTGVETVIRLRPGPIARFGERGPDITAQIHNCTLVPRTSSESDDRENTVIIGYTLVAPPLTDLKADDRILARGATWQIEGLPGDYRTKKGVAKAVIAALERVTG